jgi:uncharacterized DUF497 family protein
VLSIGYGRWRGSPIEFRTKRHAHLQRHDVLRILASPCSCAQLCIHLAVDFEWDPVKDQGNRAKHRVAFADAVGVFDDPQAVTLDDPHPQEERYVTLGLDFLGRVLVVCWAQRGSNIRIISARKATKSERLNYERDV